MSIQKVYQTEELRNIILQHYYVKRYFQKIVKFLIVFRTSLGDENNTKITPKWRPKLFSEKREIDKYVWYFFKRGNDLRVF